MHAYTKDHLGELAYKQVKMYQRPNEYAYIKDQKNAEDLGVTRAAPARLK